MNRVFPAATHFKPHLMHKLLFLLPFVLTGCGYFGGFGTFSVSQREILKRARAEIALREPWADQAAVFVTNPDDTGRSAWKIKAGAIDRSAFSPVYHGTYFVAGTERELRFTRDGCLTRYSFPGSACSIGNAASAPVPFESNK